ncbi:MAG TPA: glycosyltransferase family 4 protein [Gammaproteobacteria bacterium]|nr:glycosyltransferase family 4 protein [Gammaproteobacteria bacterium]
MAADSRAGAGDRGTDESSRVARGPCDAPSIDLVVPGDPATLTGGYLYDKRIFAALAALGWCTKVHALDASFPRPRGAALAEAADMLAAIPSGRIVVVDGLALGGLAGPLAAAARRLRLIALIHHPLALETGLETAVAAALQTAENASLELVRGIIVTSSWTARQLAGAGLSARRIRVVEPGTDPAPDREPLPGPERRLLSVGSLTPRKGHALLVSALAPLRDRPWRLDCVGSLTRDPDTAAAAQALIRRLGLDARIVLHGELDAAALADRYRQADLFVLPSYLEGYGMALADALAYGLPIVSTTAGAIPETPPADAAILVAPGDQAALTAALARVLDEPDLRARLESAALVARSRLPSWTAAGRRFAAAAMELGA